MLPLTILVIAVLGVSVAITLCPALLGAPDHRRRAGAARGLCRGSVRAATAIWPGGTASRPRNVDVDLHRPAWRHGTGIAADAARHRPPRSCRRCTSSPRVAQPLAPSATIRSRPPAQRTVATYALWTPAALDLNAAITSLGGMDKAGGSGAMSGVDACGVMPADPRRCGDDRGRRRVRATPARPDRSMATRTTLQCSLGTPGAQAARQRMRWTSTGPVSSGGIGTCPAEFVSPAWPTADEMLRLAGHPGEQQRRRRVYPPGERQRHPDRNRRPEALTAARDWEGVILVGGRSGPTVTTPPAGPS